MSSNKNKPKPDLSHIVEPLRQHAVPLEDIFEDPANPNTHDERSIRAIMGALVRYKQRLPIIVNANTNLVQIGNGRLEAARRLGWTHIAALKLDDDQLTHVSFAITENRLSDLSEMDAEALVRLLEEVKAEDPEAPMDELWDEVEWQELLEEAQRLAGAEIDLDEVEFPEYDESIADEVLMIECPKCGHKWPI